MVIYYDMLQTSRDASNLIESLSVVETLLLFIRESVDSLCRDGTDAQYMQHLKQKSYNFTTNTLKAYLSTQASSLSAFVISKTHISGQKPRGRQLNAKVCGSKSAIFHLLSFFVQTTCQTTITRKRLKYSP